MVANTYAAGTVKEDIPNLNKDSTIQEQLLPWTGVIANEANDIEGQNLACSGTYPIGNIYQERQKISKTDISGQIHVSYTPWAETGRDCRASILESRNISCPAYQSGTHSQKRTYIQYYNGSIGSDTGWVTTSNTCNYYYTSTGTEYQYLGCSAGYTGTITQQRTYQNYSDGSRRYYSGWSTISNTCTPNTVCRYNLWGPLTVIQEFKSFIATRYFLQINGENVLSNVTLSQLEAYGVTKGMYRDTNPTGAPDFYEVCGPAYLFN